MAGINLIVALIKANQRISYLWKFLEYSYSYYFAACLIRTTQFKYSVLIIACQWFIWCDHDTLEKFIDWLIFIDWYFNSLDDSFINRTL